MQKLYTLFSLILVLCILSSASCEKDSEKVEPEKPQELIIGKWLRTKAEIMKNGTWVDFNNQPCQLDDTEEFTTDGKWVYSENGTSCSTGSPVTITYVYNFSGENEYLISYYNDPNVIHTIESINKTKMVIQVHNYGPSKATFRNTLTRQ